MYQVVLFLKMGHLQELQSQHRLFLNNWDSGLRDVGMTGEITLRGRVLPIGGLKEKLLAAKRAGLKKVVLPLKNKKILEEIPESILKGLEIAYVENIDELLKHTLEKIL